MNLLNVSVYHKYNRKHLMIPLFIYKGQIFYIPEIVNN